MQKQCPYCTNMIDASVEYCPHCRAKNIKEYTLEEYSANVKSHTHSGQDLCDDNDNHNSLQAAVTNPLALVSALIPSLVFFAFARAIISWVLLPIEALLYTYIDPLVVYQLNLSSYKMPIVLVLTFIFFISRLRKVSKKL